MDIEPDGWNRMMLDGKMHRRPDHTAASEFVDGE
jgi:hypothetical protein